MRNRTAKASVRRSLLGFRLRFFCLWCFLCLRLRHFFRFGRIRLAVDRSDALCLLILCFGKFFCRLFFLALPHLVRKLIHRPAIAPEQQDHGDQIHDGHDSENPGKLVVTHTFVLSLKKSAAHNGQRTFHKTGCFLVGIAGFEPAE